MTELKTFELGVSKKHDKFKNVIHSKFIKSIIPIILLWVVFSWTTNFTRNRYVYIQQWFLPKKILPLKL